MAVSASAPPQRWNSPFDLACRSSTCLRHLKGQIEAMAPLLRPRRYLGDHMEGSGREVSPTGDRNFADLSALYGRVAIRPFDLRPELRSPLESVTTHFQF